MTLEWGITWLTWHSFDVKLFGFSADTVGWQLQRVVWDGPQTEEPCDYVIQHLATCATHGAT